MWHIHCGCCLPVFSSSGRALCCAWHCAVFLATLSKETPADCCWLPLFPVPAGIGWTDDTVQRKGSQVVDALHPAGTGIIEYEVSSLAPPRALLHTQRRSNMLPTCSAHTSAVCAVVPCRHSRQQPRRPAAAVDGICIHMKELPLRGQASSGHTLFCS